MKRKTFTLGLLLALVALVTLVPIAQAPAQVYRFMVPIRTSTAIRAATVDSLLDTPIELQSGAAFLATLIGAFPDSIKLAWNGAGPNATTSKDSINAFFTVFSRQNKGLYLTRTLLDSLIGRGTGYHVIPTTVWRNADQIGVYIAGQDGTTASANAGDALPARYSLRWEFYYHKL